MLESHHDHIVSELILSCPGQKEWLDSEILVNLDFHVHHFDRETAGRALPLESSYGMCAQMCRRKGWQWITGLTEFPPVHATSAAVEAFVTFSVASHHLPGHVVCQRWRAAAPSLSLLVAGGCSVWERRFPGVVLSASRCLSVLFTLWTF